MKITITYDNEHIEATREGAVTLENETQALLTVLLNSNLTAIANAPKNASQSLRELIYDNLNIAFANILENIIPDDETFLGNLTAEAILKAENELIDKKYRSLKKKPKPKQPSEKKCKQTS